MKNKANWGNLTKEERAEYMWRQMTPYGNSRSAYLPDDCGECNCCGQPTIGYGWCESCLRRHIELDNKLRVI